MGAGKALGFAQKIVYYCRQTIGYFLSKANSHANALSNLQPKEKTAEEKENQDAQQTEENKSEENGGQ